MNNQEHIFNEVRYSFDFLKKDHGYLDYEGEDIKPIDTETFLHYLKLIQSILELPILYNEGNELNGYISLVCSNSIDVKLFLDGKLQLLINVKKDKITWFGYSTLEIGNKLDFSTWVYDDEIRTSDNFDNLLQWIKERLI